MLTNQQSDTLATVLSDASVGAYENEHIAIGCMLSNENAALYGIKVLEEKHFYYEHNRLIFKVLKETLEKDQILERTIAIINTISEEDWQKVLLDKELTLREYIAGCLSKAVAIFNPQACFSTVKEHYVKRELLKEHIKAIQNFADTTIAYNIKEIVASTADRIKNIIDISADQKTLSFKEECLEVLADHKNTSLIPTGFTKLDELISGFRPGQFIVIGAATSMGKSAFAVNLALNICDQGNKVALWSFEMDKKEIIHRVFAIRTGLSSNILKNNTMTEEYYNTVRRYADSTSDDLVIRVDRVRNMNNFYLECRALKINNVKTIIIDYLQLINLDQGFGTNRVRELEQITPNLKIIATELGITIIALSQLSREVHKRDGKRPILSDLRDSGSIEQDADIVMFLHRPDFVLIQQGKTFDEIPREIRNTADVIVAKNRDGQTGTCSLKFDRNLTKFSN